MDAGINVGIGTDSLASNDTLSVLDELKSLSTNHALSPQTLISMATINGAKAIGLESKVGQLREGFEADICGVGLPEHPADTSTASGNCDVYQRLFSPASKNIFTMIAGVVCYNATLPWIPYGSEL